MAQQTPQPPLKIPITYASAYATTLSLAERISSEVSDASIGPLTVSNVSENLHLGDFDLLIIYSLIHLHSWLLSGLDSWN
jgi:menaquinone-dependent protoporphyrinogen IX oxidase